MSATPPSTSPSSTSPHTSPRRHTPSTGTLTRQRSSFMHSQKMSVDEGTALSDLHKKADKQLKDERRKEAEALKYWDEVRDKEQEKFSDEEEGGSNTATTSSNKVKLLDENYKYSGSIYTRRNSDRPSSDHIREDKSSSKGGGGLGGSSNGYEGATAARSWQERFQEVDSKYKESMVIRAQLYKEKTALVYQVESLKDRLEDVDQLLSEAKHENQRQSSHVLQLTHKEDTLASELENCKKLITLRDDFLERHGLHLPTGEEDEEQVITAKMNFSSEEKEQLLKQINTLKEELSSLRSSSILEGQQPKDIVQASARMVSEYKTKVQITEAENTRLEGTVNRLKGQVNRYKSQLEETEKREDELMKEKRMQGREVRRLQSECEDYKTEIDLLKKRMEQLRKRKDYDT